MEHCGTHDLTFANGGHCWNCEEQKMSPADRELAYSDPDFLKMRGGESKQSVTLSGLSAEQMKKLKSMLSEPVMPGEAGKPGATPTERKVFARA